MTPHPHPSITLIEDRGDWPVPWHRYKIEDERGWCEFTIWDYGHSLGSYGGKVWPYAWPELFEYVNPNTYQAGWVIRDRASLPPSSKQRYAKPRGSLSAALREGD